MAQQLDFTIKRYNGIDFDSLLPTTHVGQIFTDATLATTLQSVLDGKIDSTEKGAASGVAPLDSNGKILYSDLPDGMYGGLKFQDAMTVATDLDALAAGLPTADADANIGSFWMATVDVTISSVSGYSTVLAPGDEGDYDITDGIDLEAGDWVVLTSYFLNTYVWAIVNNTYDHATTSSLGMVQLSNSTSVANTSSDVITEIALNQLMGTTGTTIAYGDHLHTLVYQPYDSDLGTIAGLAHADGTIIVSQTGVWAAQSGATAQASLGLEIGVDVQAYDAMLASLASLDTSLATDETSMMFYSDGDDTIKTKELRKFSRDLMDNGTANAWRTDLELVVGTNVQAQSARLDTLAGLAATDGNFMVGNGSTYVVESGATARASMGVYSTTEVDNFFTYRPKLFYDTATGEVTGDILYDLD